MQIHLLQTRRVKVERAQIVHQGLVGQGRGLTCQLAPLIDHDWSDWLPTYAFAVERHVL